MSLAAQFQELFDGLKRAHGTYKVEGVEQEVGGKISIRPSASTLMEPVTLELWEQHLAGQRSLGIVPIDDDASCCFGVIDVDVYQGLSHEALNKKVREFGMPLIVARSKSGGAHLYLFTQGRIAAATMRAKLSELSAALGYGTAEIFPKQVRLLTERGDAGSWINMPYFGRERPAYGPDDVCLSPGEFVEYARAKRIQSAELLKLRVDPLQILEEGPPCLQHLLSSAFPKGSRNNGLYNLGVYLKKVYPDTWEAKVHEYNVKYMDPPLTTVEVGGVVKSLDRKEYRYTCSKPPIMSHCNSGLCKMRKFGIGSGSSDVNFPKLHSLSKLDTKPPLWFLDVEGSGRLELETDDLQSQQKFQRKCMDVLNMMPQPVNNQTWSTMVNDLMKNLITIKVPEEASMTGQLFSMIESFCTGRAQAKTLEEILLGKPYFDADAEEYCFRLTDLMKYLERQRFKEFKVHQITSLLKSKGVKHEDTELKGKPTTIWRIGNIKKLTEGFGIPKAVENDKSPY